MEGKYFCQMAVNRSPLDKKLEAVGWGLFFIWVGTALFAHIGWGAGLLGVGIITLGASPDVASLQFTSPLNIPPGSCVVIIFGSVGVCVYTIHH